jgi:small subunit ribosomal protein S17
MADKPDNKTPKTPEDADGKAPEVEAAADSPVEATEPLETSPAPEAEAPPAEAPQAEAPEAEAPEAETPQVEAPEAEAPEAEAPQAEAPEAEAPEAEAPQAESPEAEAPEAKTPEAEAPQAEAPEAEAPEAPAPSEPVVPGSPKERRRKARSQHMGEVRPPRSPEERHAERLVVRRGKAMRRRARRLQERAKAAERRAAAPAREPLTPVHAPVEGKRRVRQGIVVSDKAEKTITVRIDVARRHRRYEKIVRSSSTLHAHDENNDAHEGDVVRVIESRPLSRSKRWALVDVLERAR